jgi:hypothetical protein
MTMAAQEMARLLEGAKRRDEEGDSDIALLWALKELTESRSIKHYFMFFLTVNSFRGRIGQKEDDDG